MQKKPRARKERRPMKRMMTALLTAVMVLSLTACGNGAKTVDVQAFADALKNNVSYDAEMIATATEDFDYYFSVPDGASIAGYESGGETYERIVVAQCADDASAKALLEEFNSYLADLTQEAGRYTPEEVTRLEDAIMMQQGGVVVLCISADADAADTVIKGYLG